MNVYEMIAAGAFDTPGGLWVRRNSWGNTIALVTGFEPLEGPPPYFHNQAVTVDLFSTRGERIKKAQRLSCPGTFAYVRIDAPRWWTDGTLCEVLPD